MAGDVTPGALKRISFIPVDERPSEYDGGTVIGGQEYDNVEFVGGTASNLTITDPTFTDPNEVLNQLLPDQATHTGEVLKTDGTDTYWSSDIDTGITQLTGDVTAGPGSGSQAATLATVNANVGSFGSSTSIPSFTVNDKGLITAASGNVVIAPAGTLTGTTLAANVVTSSLTTVGTLANLTVTNPITGSVTGSSGSTTGNAATATALQNARTIGGVSFNGTANITVSTATAGFTITGGDLNSTGTRVSKGWFTDAEFTNAPTLGGVAATGTGGLVRATSPTLVTPALGVASATSISFGGTPLANYTENTFTPTIIGSSTAGTASYSTQTGTYTRIGNIYFCDISLTWSGGTGTGNLRIAGLPATSTVDCGVSLGLVSGVAPGAGLQLTARAVATTSQIWFELTNQSTGASTSLAYDAAGEVRVSVALRA